MSGPVQQEQLLEWVGYQRPGDLMKWLDSRKIKYTQGKDGRICTTEEAINDALFKQPTTHRGGIVR